MVKPCKAFVKPQSHSQLPSPCSSWSCSSSSNWSINRSAYGSSCRRVSAMTILIIEMFIYCYHLPHLHRHDDRPRPPLHVQYCSCTYWSYCCESPVRPKPSRSRNWRWNHGMWQRAMTNGWWLKIRTTTSSDFLLDEASCGVCTPGRPNIPVAPSILCQNMWIFEYVDSSLFRWTSPSTIHGKKPATLVTSKHFQASCSRIWRVASSNAWMKTKSERCHPAR